MPSTCSISRSKFARPCRSPESNPYMVVSCPTRLTSFTPCSPPPDLRHDRRHRTASKAPPHLRNDTKAAGMVATFGNFHIGGVVGCRQNPWISVAVEVLFASFISWRHRHRSLAGSWQACRMPWKLVGSDNCIHFRYRLEDLLPVSRDQTAGHDQSTATSAFLLLGHF